MWEQWLQQVLAWLALPENGLSSVFVIALLSATLLPMGSEPAVLGLVELNPSLFWPAIAVATLGNTLGGCVNWWLGFGAHKAVDKRRSAPARNPRVLQWLERFGAKACFFSFLPAVGDPIAAVAGWLKLPFWQCVAWMALGKFLRYVVMTWLLMNAIDAARPLL